MDAKPQRPARSRTFRDENLPPIVPQPSGKTVHTRNKSSPALSTLASMQQHSMKAGPRRTAFADVSNVVKPLAIMRDDSAIPQKSLDVHTTDSAAPFQKPAQRPLSVSSIKGFFNNLGSNQAAKPPALAEKEDSTASSNAPLAQKALARKSTVIFKEHSHPLPDLPSVQEEGPLPTPAQNLLRKKSSIYVDSNEVLPAAETVPSVSESQPESCTMPVSGSSDFRDVRSDGVPLYIPSEDPESESKGTKLLREQLVDQNEDIKDAIKPAAIRPEPLAPSKHNAENQPYTSLESVPTAVTCLKEPLPERWVEEPYAEYEEDYTTARSLKSRGETTTGPTTIVLAPKMTTEAERELVAAKKYVDESPGAAELEEDEQWDTSMVAEYSEEIFAYMRCLEEKMRPNPYYMDNQTEVQWSMRSVLMDWLVQVHHRFQLLPETLFLCVNYVDRFLSCKVVSLAKLQLVGATAIFVAAKYEEINCPSVQEIVYMVDGGYTVDEILKAERFMLSMLHFELGWPGPMSFLRRISKADDYDLETRTLAKYFLEITIMDERFVGCIPSYVAAGAHCIARLMLQKGDWSLKHVHYSTYTYTQLRPLLIAILSCCEEAQKHHAAVFDKYSDKRFKRASTFVLTEMDKGFSLPPMPSVRLLSYFDETDQKW